MKSTAVVVARTDVRVLARLAEGLVDSEVDFSTRSEFIRRCLEALYVAFRDNHICGSYEDLSHEDAMHILSRMGIGEVQSAGRGMTTLKKAISLERGLEIKKEANIDSLIAEGDFTPEWLQENIRRVELGLEPLPLPNIEEE